jgi:O-antigen/teichoic acid export membrane protein
MTAHRRYLFSAVTNWLAFAATLVTAFFLAPYLIRKLGDGPYGVWVFVESILAYFTLFDLGIAACVVRYVAKFNAARDQASINRLVSSCMALFLGLGIVAFAMGAALAPVFTPVMRKAGIDLAEVVGFLLLMLANLALSLPLSVFPSILDGLERFALKSAIRIAVLAGRTAAIVVLMEDQPSLGGLAIIFTISNLLEHAALGIACFIRLPGLRLTPRLVDRETLKLVRGYSVDAFLAMVAGRAAVQSGALIIGIFLSAPEITWFAIALRLVEFAKALLRSATTTLTPAISSLEAAGDLAGIRAVLFKATRWVLYLILPVQLGLILFGGSFLRIWLGSAEYAERCYPCLVILSSTIALVVAQSVASRILYGMGLLKTFARAALLEAAANVTLCLLLVNALGIAGAAWAAAGPNALFCLFVIRHVCQRLDASPRAYLETSWAPPLLAACVPALVWSSGWSPTGWLSLALALGAGLLPYAVVVAMLEQSRSSARGRSVLSRSRAGFNVGRSSARQQ